MLWNWGGFKFDDGILRVVWEYVVNEILENVSLVFWGMIVGWF